jgi:hypothetical protein
MIKREAEITYFEGKNTEQNHSGQERPGYSMENGKRRSKLWLIDGKVR